ncbi:hypothetical protein Plhal304r1_c048g0130621 [Plasmopara halstedii]
MSVLKVKNNTALLVRFVGVSNTFLQEKILLAKTGISNVEKSHSQSASAESTAYHSLRKHNLEKTTLSFSLQICILLAKRAFKYRGFYGSFRVWRLSAAAPSAPVDTCDCELRVVRLLPVVPNDGSCMSLSNDTAE